MKQIRLFQSVGRGVAGFVGRESFLIRRLRPLYERALDWSSGGNGILWDINGVTYRIDPQHRHRLGQNYDTPVADFLRSRVRPGALCLDVGANVGVYVLQFAHWSKPSGRVIAFEPNPDAQQVLERHIRLNKISERTEIIAAAVGAAAGEAILFASGADGMTRLAAPNPQLANRVREVRVPVVTLDRFCEARSIEPDWLLIDIEGFEVAALSGARQLINRRGSALGIIVEMHPSLWALSGTSRAALEALLAELGLRAEPLTGQKDPLGEYGIVRLEPRIGNSRASAARLVPG